MVFAFFWSFFPLSVFSESVLVLTEQNFDTTVNAADIILVEFYAPWCGHCKSLAPEYEKAASMLEKEDPPIPLAKVDATVETNLASRFGVSGYPTLKIFRNGAPTDYSGPRDATGIANYMRKESGPAAKQLNTKELLDKFKSFVEDIGIVGYFKDTKAANVFVSTANALRNDFRFGIVSNSDLIEDEGVVMYRPFTGEDSVIKYNGAFVQEDIRSWIEEYAVPVAGIYNKNNAKRFHLPRVTLFAKADLVADAKQIVYYLNRLRKVAKSYLGKLHFVLADKTDQGADFSTLGFDQAQKWGLAIIGPSGKYKYTGDTFSPEKLQKFVEDYTQGKLEKYLKSEPAPEQATKDGLTTVVAKTFDELVNIPKDVFIEFYAPWCGHCKQLAPEWEALAKSVEDIDSLVIAKMDATANDVPPEFNVRGFPTIFLSKANDKKHPVAYEGDRKAANFRKWLKSHVSIPFDKEL